MAKSSKTDPTDLYEKAQQDYKEDDICSGLRLGAAVLLLYDFEDWFHLTDEQRKTLTRIATLAVPEDNIYLEKVYLQRGAENLLRYGAKGQVPLTDEQRETLKRITVDPVYPDDKTYLERFKRYFDANTGIPSDFVNSTVH